MNKLILAVLLSSVHFHALAEDEVELGKCQDAGVLTGEIITDTPWESMYPIRLLGSNVSPTGSGAPDEATSDIICSCEDDLGIYIPGFTQSMYEPARIVELVREPDCMMSLGGAEMNMTDGRQRGTTGANEQQGGSQAAFWHYHYFAYPLLMMLEMLSPNRCGDGYLSMDLLYFSEVDPTWADEELAFFANPESVIFGNPISVAACLVDGAAATVGKPINSLFWCSGAWGGMYPFSGYATGKSSLATKTSLLATRSVAALHRRLLARKTMGSDALCSAELFPTIPKTQYKMNMIYPVAETQDAHEIGEPAFLWGEWRNIPTKEDAVYMLWRWNDCCFML